MGGQAHSPARLVEVLRPQLSLQIQKQLRVINEISPNGGSPPQLHKKWRGAKNVTMMLLALYLFFHLEEMVHCMLILYIQNLYASTVSERNIFRIFGQMSKFTQNDSTMQKQDH